MVDTGKEKTVFNLVGVGASAGGIEALSELLASLPPAPGMAFVVVQHRDPSHPSLLSEILSKTSRVPIVDAQDGMALEIDHVYVIPAMCTVAAAATVLHLHRHDNVEQRRMPIDSMFKSLADNREHNSIGIVLSGTGSDGTLGIQEIKESGGIIFAQEPESARFDGMPKKAIETGCVDFILTPKEIAKKIVEIGRHPYLSRSSDEAPEKPSTDENSLNKIFRVLRTQAHVDFSQYKRGTIQRRLARRMALRQIKDLSQYADLVRDDRNEMDALVQDFLIRVTRFFRDPEVFKGLKEIVFPKLIENRSQQEPLRIWVPGCATGEEVYSVAIALTEFLADGSIAVPIQVFGTDLSEMAIGQARTGEYVSNIEHNVSRERLERFFVKLDDHYQIAKSLRGLCVFARHDVTSDPPFSRIDLVCCRNVLIYFDEPLQRRVIRSFHYALKPHGYLELGPSEGISHGAELFQIIDAPHRIYRKLAASGQTAIEPNSIKPASPPPAVHEKTAAHAPIAPDISRAQPEIERMLLARYAPASVLIDEGLNIIYFQGETAPYLEHARGNASLNLQKVVRPHLLMEISSALEQVRNEGVPARKENVHFELSGENLAVHIEVAPLKMPDSDAAYYAIVFEKAAPPRAPSIGGRFTRWWTGAVRTRARVSETDKDRQIRQLQHELEVTRNYLQATIEKHETVQEELKASHEEALSVNEEFQSTNEELETAKEELQSTNEELSTTNEELRNRNRESNELNEALRHSRDHLSAIIDTLREPFLVLDSELRVLEANPAFYNTFKIDRKEVENKLIYEIGDGEWNFPGLRRLLEEVLPKNTSLRDYEFTHTFPAIGTRTVSLNARRVTGNGSILLAIEDITDRGKAVEVLKQADRQKNQFLAMLSHELRNPLAPIANALLIIRAQGGNPAKEHALAIIERQIGQLTRLTTDLLDVARVTSGAILLQREVVELKSLIDRAVETSRPIIDQLDHKLSASTSGGPIWLYADATRMEQVLVNLLTNAAKYTDRGGQIWLTAQCQDRRALIHVRDTGIGIEPELLPEVFNIFTQSPRGLARSQGGLGIGLSIARNLVEMHGGTIEARSDGPGKGSDFFVSLPVSDPPRAQPAPVSGDGRPKQVAKSMRVLIVDDSEDTAESAALLFSSWNHDVRVAHTGREALKVAFEYDPDVILLDIGLPEMDGYEVARRLRQDSRFKKTLIVALSGYGGETAEQRSLDAGFDEHLTKPADLEKLKGLLIEKVNLKQSAN